MKKPRSISIRDYNYSLPEHSIAKYPLAERDASKLLIFKEGKIAADIYQHIASHIPSGSFVIFNNTKVVEARLQFQKATGGVIEIFCLEPYPTYKDVTVAMMQQGSVLWQCMIGGASKWKPGNVLEKLINTTYQNILLQARFIEKAGNVFIIELSWTPPALSFSEILHLAGNIPLPPYIKRPAEATDKVRYQTVYADTEGSVAAPTAGLHFTDTIFTNFSKKNIRHSFVTLHVGAGTFRPVKTETIGEHDMHAEWIDVSKPFIEKLYQQNGEPIIAVGTTSLRTIETLYWLGVKIIKGKTNWADTSITQWEPYELDDNNIPVKEALAALLAWLKYNDYDRLITRTQILIAPGYSIKVADGLITNFHQPQSTLLLLVAALIGKHWKDVYDYAIENEFRFLSYGDGSLLWKKND
jgi:S-adenosylmethionine:tRNA ribosyltransferase-isomerase